MRALVTNDDGIDSRGLATLARLAVEAGLEVVVAAPHEERSGSSASLTALSEDGQLQYSPYSAPDLGDLPCYAVEASPALIAFVAVNGAFGGQFDLVLSGINHGPNTGIAVLHSGTVGAAITAAVHGTRSLAISLAATKPEHWDSAELVCRRAIAWMMSDAKPGSVLNVNVPDVPSEELLGIAPAALSRQGAVQAEIGETSDQFITVEFAETWGDDEGGTDAGLVAKGWATATVLRGLAVDLTDDLSSLQWQA
jgi:5'-nucleotidase